MTRVLVVLKDPENEAMRFETRLPARHPGVIVSTVKNPAMAPMCCEDADVMITLGTHLGEHAGDIFDRARRLKWVQVIGTGVDNVVGHPALRRDVVVTNARGIHGAQMSEAAVSSMLALARDLPQIMRNQSRRLWRRFAPRLLANKTVGIVGVGAITETLGPLCQALGMKTIGFSSAARDVPGLDRVYPTHQLTQMAGGLDYLVVLTPYSAATHGLIDAHVLEAMKASAFLINLARGGVVDEDALLAALRSGQIAGAALDVFVGEPLPQDHPFWGLENVIVTPHLGGFHEAYSDQVLQIVTDNLGRYLSGGPQALIHRA